MLLLPSTFALSLAHALGPCLPLVAPTKGQLCLQPGVRNAHGNAFAVTLALCSSFREDCMHAGAGSEQFIEDG